MRAHSRVQTLLKAAIFSLVPILGIIGCGGDNLPREAVSGSVSVDHKPLKTGLITFVPDGLDIPTQGGANIADGKYSIPRSAGLVPGKYKVVVSSGEGSVEKKVDDTNNMPGMPPIPAKEVIPPRYGAATTLGANVTAGGKNEFEFDLIAGSKGK